MRRLDEDKTKRPKFCAGFNELLSFSNPDKFMAAASFSLSLNAGVCFSESSQDLMIGSFCTLCFNTGVASDVDSHFSSLPVRLGDLCQVLQRSKKLTFINSFKVIV